MERWRTKGDLMVMKVGDLVKVNKRCDAGGLWHKIGIVICVNIPHVRVLIGCREHLFDYCVLEVINESR